MLYTDATARHLLGVDALDPVLVIYLMKVLGVSSVKRSELRANTNESKNYTDWHGEIEKGVSAEVPLRVHGPPCVSTTSPGVHTREPCEVRASQ